MLARRRAEEESVTTGATEKTLNSIGRRLARLDVSASGVRSELLDEDGSVSTKAPET